MGHNRIYNFSAGPSMLPETVLEKAAAELLNYGCSGMSVMEMSHRSSTYDSIINSVQEKFRNIFGVSDDYNVLFLQGGATLQFAMAPMNLIAKTGKADYAITGSFSGKAKDEAVKYGTINIAATSKDRNFAYIPQQDALKLSDDAAYFHYCHNNTIYGSTWNYIPQTKAPLVCDMSSSILSQPVDVSKYGIIYAGAQKNMAPAGLTVVVIRKDLELCPFPYTPVMMDYAVLAKDNSMYNTPNCYAIYILGLVLDWVKDLGGLTAMAEINAEKAALLYNTLDNSALFQTVIDKEYRSKMNVTFKTGDEALDKKFVKEAEKAGMTSLGGHRSVGGMRASIYNAMPREGVVALSEFIKKFELENR